jgi:hypothetical protein
MQSFVIEPAGLRPFWLLVPVGVILLGVALLLAVTLLGSRSARFEISPEGLRLRGDLYGRLIPRSELRAREATRVVWSAQPGLAPAMRTLGTGLPGYQAGWFRLENGEKALLYLTDRERAVYVPTTRGHCILLSPADPDGFVRSLQALGEP